MVSIARKSPVSPHTRGWTSSRRRSSRARSGFPAHAGMDLGRREGLRRQARFPRTRGDGPVSRLECAVSAPVSPHTRGWTPAEVRHRRGHDGFPAHAGMDPRPPPSRRRAGRFPRTRGDGPEGVSAIKAGSGVSPHTRGWTPADRSRGRQRAGFPAHAGMDLTRHPDGRYVVWFPRTRGDGPVDFPLPVVPRMVSPHTRGWT